MSESNLPEGGPGLEEYYRRQRARSKVLGLLLGGLALLFFFITIAKMDH